jgi:hypothetical protein
LFFPGIKNTMRCPPPNILLKRMFVVWLIWGPPANCCVCQLSPQVSPKTHVSSFVHRGSSRRPSFCCLVAALAAARLPFQSFQ